MLSVCTDEFLSHPTEKGEKHLLVDHLLKVGASSREIFSQTKFSNTNLAFYSGLLHDVGKVNPFYQEIFHGRKTTEEAKEEYIQEHSIFSSWAVDKLLQKSDLDYDTIDKIMIIVYGHHSTIRKSLGKREKGDKFIKTHDATNASLPDFLSQMSQNPKFPKFNWDSCKEKFSRSINFDLDLKSKNSPNDYLELSCAFSCLLQADRGSFHKWCTPNFTLDFKTQSLISDSRLGKIRTDFQKYVMKKFGVTKDISIINAPTGIGKTKVFLDIINKLSENKNIERIFYFSPLLALTEDFESKISKVTSENDQKDILIYNHMYSGSLYGHNDETKPSNKWEFEHESFNKQFVITTTQRLLMTIYSNTASDKLKFASFKNSVLIIDEIQTIPKPILSNLKKIFKTMNQYMGTRFILVSATIPHELKDIESIKLPSDILPSYLSQTKKQIKNCPLDIPKIPIKQTLVMANTRKKASHLYSEIKQKHPTKKIIYLSSGIKKRDRKIIIKNLSEKKTIIQDLSEKEKYVLVATQVVEAGVDISFSHIFREQAPLDNIIQVMGRLNREGENPDATLVIYPTDQRPIPYSPLEFQVTQEKIKEIENSVQIYGILESYYDEISKRNNRNIEDAEKLERLIDRMDFGEVWKFVRDMALPEDSRDAVFIPEINDWDSVKNELLYGVSRENFKKFGDLTASLPISSTKIKEYFDEELMEKNILLPKKECLVIVYDENIGLDKWLVDPPT